ncbi:MAG: hypothetical protein ACRDVN_03455 [Jiangellaceae bacterium]
MRGPTPGTRAPAPETPAPTPGLVRLGTDPVLGLAGDGDVDRARFRQVLFSEIVPSPEYAQCCTRDVVVEVLAVTSPGSLRSARRSWMLANVPSA